MAKLMLVSFRCVHDGGFEAPIAKIKAYSYAGIGSASSNNINEEVLRGFGWPYE